MNANLVDETQGRTISSGESMALRSPLLQTREHLVSSTSIYKVMQRFNRNTTWVAIGLLAPVIFAALMVPPQERQLKVDDLTEGLMQTRGDLLPNANPAALSDVARSNEKSIGEITSRQATNVDSGLTPAVQSNPTSASLAPQQDSAEVLRSKIPNVRHRSSVRSRVVNVKMRLIALWHQSLAPMKKSRKKVGYTLATGH